MKINVKNVDDVQVELDRVNGRATRHTYYPTAVRADAQDAEKKLADFGLNIAERRGCRAVFISGSKLPNSYSGHSVRRTTITLERGHADWFLVHAYAGDYSPTSSTGLQGLFVPEEKIASAHARRLRQFKVMT